MFSFVPSSGTIEPDGSCKVTVTFSPDHTSDKFIQVIQLDVPNKSDKEILTFFGRGFSRQLYLYGGDEVYKPETLPKRIEENILVSTYKAMTTSNPFSFLESEENTSNKLTLTILKSDAEIDPKTNKKTDFFIKTILVGSCKISDTFSGSSVLTYFSNPNINLTAPTSKPAAKGDNKGDKEKCSYSLEPTAETKTDGFFTAEPLSGSVVAGQKLPINFKFNLTKYRASRNFLVSHWYQGSFKCNLKGGLTVNQNAKPEETATIIVKYFVDINANNN